MQKIVQNIEKNLPNFELMIKLKRLWHLNHQIVLLEQLIKYARCASEYVAHTHSV